MTLWVLIYINSPASMKVEHKFRGYQIALLLKNTAGELRWKEEAKRRNGSQEIQPRVVYSTETIQISRIIFGY